MISYKRVNSENEDFINLVKELDQYLASINGEQNSFFALYNKIDYLHHVVLAYEGSEAIGCGAFKEYDEDTVEIKRMYVKKTMRGKGIAGNILQELQAWAKELGFNTCILETGDKMIDAINLYKKHHYIITPNYGQYQEVESSVCFRKKI